MPERRPSVTVRISLFALLAVLLSPLAALFVLMIASPALAGVVANGFGALAVIMAIAGIMLARRLFSPHWRPPPGPSDSDGGGGGGGGGSGPREPAAPPGAPRGGIPLPASAQSRERIRDHDRPGRRQLRPRRPVREPNRSPVRRRNPLGTRRSSRGTVWPNYTQCRDSQVGAGISPDGSDAPWAPRG
jgi:hypothetical protein